MKPYINLPAGFPGIVGLFMFDRELSQGFTSLGQTLMRRPSTLSVGERELIFAFVSQLNDCKFCAGSHTACAKYTGNPELVKEVLEEHYVDNLGPKMGYLLCVASCVQSLDRDGLPDCIAGAKREGATDQEIHDTVAIASFACMCNRYVDGLGTTYEESDLDQGGRSLATYGYKMTFKRFFLEVLPQMWKRWRNTPH